MKKPYLSIFGGNAARSICALCAVLSLAVFFAPARELVILFGEKLAGKTIDHALWSQKLMRWGAGSFCCFAAAALYAVSDRYAGRLAKLNAVLTSAAFCRILAVCGSMCVIILACQSRDVWLDETFSLGLARHSAAELISLTAQDVHPPLYYLLLRAGTVFAPHSIAAAKIVSAVPVIVILFAAAVFFTREFGAVYGSVFVLILLATGSVLEYAVEIRMYSWAMLFCLLCCIFSYYIVKTGLFRYFVWYVLCAVCGAYCHYWTAVALAVNFALISLVYLYAFKNWKYVCAAAALGIALYLPWFSVVIAQVSAVTHSYWIEPLTVKTVITYLLGVLPLDGIGKVFAAGALAVFFVRTVRRMCKKDIWSFFAAACLLTPFLVLLCAVILSIAVRPLFVVRYIVPAIVFVVFYAAFSCRAWHIERKNVCVLLCAGLALACVAFVSQYRTERTRARETDAFYAVMEEHLHTDTVFVFSEQINEHIPRCFAYLYPQNGIYGCDIPELWTEAYGYDERNLTDTLSAGTDVCVVLNADEALPEQYAGGECVTAALSTYRPLKLCFAKTRLPLTHAAAAPQL